MLFTDGITRQRTPLLLSCLFLFFYTGVAWPQVQSKSSEDDDSGSLLTIVFEDLGHITTSPLRMSKTDGLKLAALSAMTLGLALYADERIDEEYASNEDKFPYVIGRIVGELGREYGRDDRQVFYFFGGLSASVLTGGLLLHDKKLLKTTGLITESFVFTLFITGATKLVLGRSRPYTERDSTDVDFFALSRNTDFHSMPSAHTSSAFAMMTVIAKQYSHWWVEIPAYAFATGVAFQRIEAREHWMSDVIVSGIMGYFVASVLVKKHAKGESQKYALKPFVSANSIGLSLRF